MKKQIDLLIFAKSIDGGTGKFVDDLYKNLSSFFNIYVVCLEKPQYRKNFLKNGVFFHPVGFFPLKYKLNLKNIICFIWEIFKLKNVLSSSHSSVVLSVDLHCNLLALINKLLFCPKLKVINTTHINLTETIKSKSSHFLNLLLIKTVGFFYNRSDVLISISKGVAQNLRTSFLIKKPIKVVYYGISSIENLNRKYINDKNIIISIGRLVEQKNFQLLIKTYYHVQKILPNSILIIIGDGPMKQKLINLINTLKLNKKVRILGWKNNVEQYLQKSGVFVLSSKREGLSYVILEAMKNGLPVISTTCYSGPSEILENGRYGILVPVGDEKKLAKEIVALLTNEKKYNYYAQKALERSRYFSENRMLNYYKELIYDLVNSP